MCNLFTQVAAFFHRVLVVLKPVLQVALIVVDGLLAALEAKPSPRGI